jgi:hypothetical protein
LVTTRTQLSVLTEEHARTVEQLRIQTQATSDATHLTTIVVDTVHKDGTTTHVVKTVKDEVKKQASSDTVAQTDKTTDVVQKVDQVTQVSVPVPQARSKYSIEAWRDGLPTATDWHPNAVSVGARLGDLPAWAEARYSFKAHEISLGLRLEF